ncbi:MAG TPA: hypothetical protein VHG91_20850 [Longimicrobium sp.]|nr:hypothetical protein [Longimicrobium sp.]
MDTTTIAVVVVRMTGILLMTPSDSNDAEPMHVLMPRLSTAVPTHFAQIGYRTLVDPGNCVPYVDKICYLNMDGWYTEIGSQRNPGGKVTLPPNAPNVSDGVNMRLAKELLTDAPDPTRVRARVTLLAGQETKSCALAKWRWVPQSTGAEQRLDMASVVDWRIPNVPLSEGRLVIVRRRFHEPNVTDTIHVESANGRIELFVRHVIYDELDHVVSTQPRAVLGDAAQHFDEYYNLLGHSGDRPIPYVSDLTGYPKRCAWEDQTPVFHAPRPFGRPGGVRALGEDFDSPGMLSCMVASARPES